MVLQAMASFQKQEISSGKVRAFDLLQVREWMITGQGHFVAVIKKDFCFDVFWKPMRQGKQNDIQSPVLQTGD
ncbi:hypothetical protein AY586_16505 [Marichromatium gracile]|uniref:Uncharacterized protein n=1 Tax=Marichromatium gracile TaxID=1048 RepID=A0ABR5VCW9_MARGR|nr:hypothetical protein AY586_16505 [Marichromatium gracile]